MYEVELKVRADHDAIRDRLGELGADHHGSVVQVDTYYDAPHRDYAETDEALRLRRTDRSHGTGETTTVVTYKGPLVEEESKTREEVEADVGDGETMDAVLQSVGFEPVATVCKERDRFVLDGFRVVLDDVEDVGEFVEIEAEADEESIERVRDDAVEVLERLGLGRDAGIRTSYLEMVLDGA